LPVSEDRDQFDQHLLGFAQNKKIEVFGQRFRVKHTGASPDHPWVLNRACLREEWNSPQVKHRQDIGIAQFVLKTETHEIEIAESPVALERSERLFRSSEVSFQINPGSIDAIRHHPLAPIQELIEQLQSEVAHPDFINIRKGQSKPHPSLLEALVKGIDLIGQVAAGLLNSCQISFHDPRNQVDTIHAKS